MGFEEEKEHDIIQIICTMHMEGRCVLDLLTVIFISSPLLSTNKNFVVKWRSMKVGCNLRPTRNS